MRLISAICVAFLALAAPLGATPSEPGEHYDLLFRNGTLDGMSPDAELLYTRTVTNTLAPDAAARDSGQIVLMLGGEGAKVAQMELRRDGKHRGLGRFPSSVGNPMIMFFYETVIRDMAEAAGGSPYYIRNRVKDALVAPAEVETGEAVYDGKTVATRIVRIRPFADDPNRDRMQGFGDLEMRVVMSEEVPGWYLSLTAETSADPAAAVYRSEMRFDGVAGQ